MVARSEGATYGQTLAVEEDGEQEAWWLETASKQAGGMSS